MYLVVFFWYQIDWRLIGCGVERESCEFEAGVTAKVNLFEANAPLILNSKLSSGPVLLAALALICEPKLVLW